MRRWILSLIALLSLSFPFSSGAQAADDQALAWPPITQQTKPWTRWWWMGSAVDKPNISRLLDQYQRAGFGGVEICPIYGAHGYEKRFIDYLSPKWMDMLDWTTAEGKRLGMGIDMTTGTGWPMGGPNTSVADSSSVNVGQRYDAVGGTPFHQSFGGDRVQYVGAFGSTGQFVDLTDQVGKTGDLDWTPPEGTWRVYTVVQHGPIMQVKRAAPGDVGPILDPFSVTAMKDFLALHDKAFANYHGIMPAAQFHDSYEYQGNWSNDLFAQFKKYRGYDLRTQIAALYGDGSLDLVSRVHSDYRQTLADMHMAYVKTWVDWCHAHHMLAREQAHGAPANLLDLYASADVPETEIFRAAAVDEDMPMNKFASSAAHVTGKQLASSESFTWLREHFQVAFSDIKPAADYLFLTGINHIIFHGVAYSPQDVAWPGWLFYASVDFNPNGGLWHDLPAFTSYVAHCQSILQSGKPSNDVLVYWPVFDQWSSPTGTMIQFAIGGQNWCRGTAFYSTAVSLLSKGYGNDYVSDAQLANATIENGSIILGGNTYQVLVVPPTQRMPADTLMHIVNLAKAGGRVIFQDAYPQDVPGLSDLDINRAEFKIARDQLPAANANTQISQGAPVGGGYVWIGGNLHTMLQIAGVQRETMNDLGLRYVRRTHDDGTPNAGFSYFIANRTDTAFDGWITLAEPAASVAILDPMHPDRSGVAVSQRDASGGTRVYVQLQPDESCFLRTYTATKISGPAWNYIQSAGDGLTLGGKWKIHFIESVDGSSLKPADISTENLASWTTLGDAESKRFAGTGRHTLEFTAPASRGASDWILDLGKVCESARVSINGTEAGTLIAPPYQLRVGSLIHPGKNTLQVDVTNLAANKIADLDRRGVKWKIFYEINYVNLAYTPFNAADWPERDSGLLGPVKLIPMKAELPADAPAGAK